MIFTFDLFVAGKTRKKQHRQQLLQLVQTNQLQQHGNNTGPNSMMEVAGMYIDYFVSVVASISFFLFLVSHKKNSLNTLQHQTITKTTSTVHYIKCNNMNSLLFFSIFIVIIVSVVTTYRYLGFLFSFSLSICQTYHRCDDDLIDITIKK